MAGWYHQHYRRDISYRAVRPFLIVVPTPGFHLFASIFVSIFSQASSWFMNQCVFKHSVLSFELKASMKALSIGFPRREKSSVTRRLYAHKSMSREINSLLLSTLMVLE